MNDAKVSFKGKREEESESIWRDWFRRSGICRADCKLILEAADWVEIQPKEQLLLRDDCDVIADKSNDDGGNVQYHYYCVSGTVECFAKHPEGERRFLIQSGEFVNALEMQRLFGQAQIRDILEAGVPKAFVTSDSIMDSGRKQNEPGALLLRWTESQLEREVMQKPCHAGNALRLCVNESCLHSLYREALSPSMRERFDRVQKVRRKHNTSELPRDAADGRRPLYKQWQLQHGSLRDLWQPSPFSRSINQQLLGSQELLHDSFIEDDVQVCRAEMEGEVDRVNSELNMP